MVSKFIFIFKWFHFEWQMIILTYVGNNKQTPVDFIELECKTHLSFSTIPAEKNLTTRNARKLGDKIRKKVRYGPNLTDANM